jgi:putative ABC transport system permease protein
MRQFLYEAIVLTLSGGVIGIAFGAIISFLISVAATKFAGFNFPFRFSIEGAALGTVVAVGIGLVFGIFPAKQAAKKSPIEALRYE